MQLLREAANKFEEVEVQACRLAMICTLNEREKGFLHDGLACMGRQTGLPGSALVRSEGPS